MRDAPTFHAGQTYRFARWGDPDEPGQAVDFWCGDPKTAEEAFQDACSRAASRRALLCVYHVAKAGDVEVGRLLWAHDYNEGDAA